MSDAPNNIDWGAVRKALEEANQLKTDYHDLLLKKGFSESMIKVVSDNLSSVMEPFLKELVQTSKTANEGLVKGISDAFKGVENNDSSEVVKTLSEGFQNLQRVVEMGNNVDNDSGIIRAIEDGFKGIKLEPQISVSSPDLTVPEPQVHFTMPDQIKAILDYDAKNPLPVLLMDTNGKPFVFSNLPGSGSGGPQTAAGGRGDFFTLSYTNSNPLPVSLVSGAGATSAVNISDSSGVGYSGSNPVPVTLISGTISSTKAQIGNSDGDFSAANPLPVSFSPASSQAVTLSDGQGSTITSHQFNTDFRAIDVYIGGAFSTVGASLVDSSGAQYSGSNPLPIVGPVVVTSITNTAAANIVDSSGVAYSGSNPLPIVGPVVVTSITNTVAAMNIDSSGVGYSGSNPLPITIISNGVATTAANIVDSSGVAYSGSNPLPIVGPVVVTSITNTTAANIVDSSGVAYSGSNPLPIVGPVVVTSITNTVAAMNIDSTGVGYSGSNPLPITIISGALTSTKAQIGNSDGDFSVANPLPIVGPVVVTSITNSSAAAITDSSGVQYSGSNPLPVTIVSGAGSSTVAVGDSAARSADNGGNPLKIGGIARTTNPTAYADGDRSNLGTDKMGRMLNRPVQVRDLIKTAYVTVSTQAETTILTGASSTFADCIMLAATNASASAWKVDIRTTTGGGIVHTMYVPANTGPIGWNPTVPYPQGDTNATWTATISSGADVSNANLTITGLFSQEL